MLPLRSSLRCFTLALLGVAFSVRTAVAEEPAAITMIVVDRETKAPIADCDLDVRVDSERAKLKTDGEGRLFLDLPDTPKYLAVTVAREGYSPMAARWEGYNKPMVLPKEQTIMLPKAEPVGGTILDADGKPVAGATVHISFKMPGDTELIRSGINWQVVKVDDQGHWSFPTAPAGYSEFQFSAFHMTRGGNREGYYYPTPITDAGAKDALRANKYEFRLPPVRLVKGKVLDNDGSPIADAEIALGESRGSSNSMPAVKSDGEGHFEIGIAPDADVMLLIKEAKHAPQIANVKNTDKLGDLDIKLAPSNPLRGRVVNAKGEPIGKASVSISSWRGTRALDGRVQTGPDGYFVFKGAPADPVELEVYAADYAEQSGVKATAGTDVVVTMTSPITFTGTVVDADTKKPIGKFDTVIAIVFSENQAPSWQRQYRESKPEINADDGTFTQIFTQGYPGRIIRVEAEGYAPVDSPKFSMKDGDQKFTFEMHKAEGIKGVVQSADGKPVVGVTAYLVQPGQPLQVQNGEIPEHAMSNAISMKTNDEGAFSFPPQTDPYLVYITTDAGFANVTREALAANATIKLEPWATVTGKAFIGSKPAAGATVQGYSSQGWQQDKPTVMTQLNTSVDADGNYSLTHVPAGEWTIGRRLQLDNRSSTMTSAQHVAPKAGETVTLNIGNRGRPVIGKIAFSDELKSRSDWTAQYFSLSTKVVQPPLPKGAKALRGPISQADREKYMATDEWKAYMVAAQAAQSKSIGISAKVEPDGSFRFEDVEPGAYDARGNIMVQSQDSRRYGGEMLAAIVSEDDIVIPAGGVDEAFEIKSIVTEMNTPFTVGSPAPNFKAPTFDGKTVKLTDLKGKFVLVHFWSSSEENTVADVTALKKSIEPFKADDRLAVVSLDVDESLDDAKAFAAKNEMTWTLGYLGSGNENVRVAMRYGMQPTATVALIGADGKLVATGLTGASAGKALEDALKAK